MPSGAMLQPRRGVSMGETKTKATDLRVADYIAALPDAARRADAATLVAIYESVTGAPATMWGPSMIGFGAYDYVYDSGHGGTAMRAGFAPRKGNIVLYLSGDGELAASPLLAGLGKHKTGKGCLYVTRLADVDMAVLTQLIRESWSDMAMRYPQ